MAINFKPDNNYQIGGVVDKSLPANTADPTNITWPEEPGS